MLWRFDTVSLLRTWFWGRPRRIVDKPEDIERIPGMLSRSPGEVTYMRVSAGSQVISIRTNDSGPFIDQFMLKSNGELVEIAPSQ